MIPLPDSIGKTAAVRTGPRWIVLAYLSVPVPGQREPEQEREERGRQVVGLSACCCHDFWFSGVDPRRPRPPAYV